MSNGIRPFTQSDVDFAMAQTAREGWDTTTEVFEICLARDADGCFIAEEDGRPVGMVTTTCYGNVAWIGNLIVIPERRSQGLGRRLMTRAMDHLLGKGLDTIRLEADPPGVALYESLGFVPEFESLRFRLDPAASDGPPTSAGASEIVVERLRSPDYSACAELDRAGFGADRMPVLAMILERAGAVRWLRNADEVLGYAALFPSTVGVRLGPCVARGPDHAQALVAGLLADQQDSPVILGVPETNAAAVAMYETLGFCRTPSCLRMVRGPRQTETGGDSQRIYAIGNGAMG